MPTSSSNSIPASTHRIAVPLRVHIAVIATIAVVTGLLYAQVHTHGYIEFDDTVYIPENAVVREGLSLAGVRWAFTTLYAANWHPLTWISHMLDVSLFGLDPGAHHLVNVALHALTGMLLYAMARHCLARRDTAAMVALLFVVHPQHVESVAWLAERKDLLCAVFFVLAILAYFHYLRGRGFARYALIMLAAAAALLAKPMAVSLPVILLLLDVWPLDRLRDAPQRRVYAALMLAIEKLPLVMLSLASCVVTVYAQQRSGAVTGLESLSFAGRLGNAVLAYGCYLRDFVLPDRLALFYPLRSMDLLRQIVPAALLLLALLAIAWRLRATRPALLVGLLWFLVTLLPVIGLVHVGSQSRADRYMYIPSIGLLLALASLVPPTTHASYRKALAFVSGVAVFWGGLCYMQIGYWESPALLYQRTAAVTGENLFAETRLIDQLIAQGQIDDAASRTETALQRYPGRYETLMSMGNVLMARGLLQEAETWFRAARERAPAQWHLLNNLGIVVYRQGRTAEGCAILQEAARLAAESTLVRGNLLAGNCAAQSL